MSVRLRVARGIALLALAALGMPAGAQQFDNFNDESVLGDFDFGELPRGEGAEDQGFSLDGDTGLTPGLSDSDMGLVPGAAPQGSFESFPGVTGPVTSISQPETAQGRAVVLRALDKMLGQPADLEMSVGQAVVFGRIAIRVSECRYPVGDPGGDAFVRMEILDLDGNSLFAGWMIASSPALNALEHPRYDVWVLGCSA